MSSPGQIPRSCCHEIALIFQAAVSIQQVELVGRPRERYVVTLGMNIDERLREAGNDAARYCASVHSAGAAASLEVASEHQSSFIRWTAHLIEGSD